MTASQRGEHSVTLSASTDAQASRTLTATATGMTDILLQWNTPEGNGTDPRPASSFSRWDTTPDDAPIIPHGIDIDFVPDVDRRWRHEWHHSLPKRRIRSIRTPGVMPVREYYLPHPGASGNSGGEDERLDCC